MQKHPSPAGQGKERVFLCPVTGPAAACKKPYFFPPGVSVLNKKKEGRCTHIWCSCHLNLFQHLCIIFLLSGTRAFQMSLRRPIWDAFSFYRHSEGLCGMCRRGGPLSDGLHQSVTPLPPIYDILFPILNRNGSFPLPGGSRFCISCLLYTSDAADD